MSIWRLAYLAVAAIALSGQSAAPPYEAGQVWEYRTRPQDAGSLIKIQQVGEYGDDTVYHISIVGVRFATPGISGVLPHIPVSEATLQASVTRRSSARTDFPTTALQSGIAEWQRAKGGVFTLSVSRIIDIIDDQTGQARAGEAPPEKL